MSKPEDVEKSLREYGQILFTNRPKYIVELVMSLMGAEKTRSGKIKSVVYLSVFENLDEITQSNDATHALLTLQFIDFCYKNFGIIEEGKK